MSTGHASCCNPRLLSGIKYLQLAELAYEQARQEREVSMKSWKVFTLVLVACLAALPLWAGGACCAKEQAVSRQVENIAGGVKLTLTATDPQAVAKLQQKAEACSGECKDCPMHAPGVNRKVEKTDNGVVITVTSSDPKQAEAIQAHAASMADKAKGACCGKASKAGKGASCTKGSGHPRT